MKAVGIIEFRSIARGVETADIMMKTSNIILLRSATVCPGKYLIIVSGDTASVHEAVKAGAQHGAPYVVGTLEIPNIDPQVVHALEGNTTPKTGRSVGVVEYYSVVDAILGADAAVKASNVDIIEIRMGFAIGGKGFFTLTGEISEVRSAVDAAKKISAESGMMVETSVISAITPEVYAKLF